MPDEEITGYATAIAGGIGLGLLLGSEYPGEYTTLLGAVFVLITLACLAGAHLRRRREK